MSPANLNAPGQVVIAGTTAAVQRAGAAAKARGAKRVIPLAVSAPFHCALMKPAEDRLAPELRALTVQAPRRPVVANIDAEPKRDGAAAVEALVRQVSGAVQWEAVVRRLASEGVRTYVEVGPGTVLAGLVRKIDRDARRGQPRRPRRTRRPGPTVYRLILAGCRRGGTADTGGPDTFKPSVCNSISAAAWPS